MENNDIEELFNICTNLDIPEIDESTNFWLIRSEGGLLYEEFVKDNFVALGWNPILESDVKSAKESKNNMDNFLKSIKTKFETDRPGGIFNKCDKFINYIKPGDYLMIPARSNSTITFAIAGEYYEEKTTQDNEAELKALKETGWSEVFGKKPICPFFKRRKINVIKTLSGNNIHPNLFKALISYHGLSTINDYANEILSSIYPIYLVENKINMVFDVKTEKPIDAEIFSSFISSSSSAIKSSNNNNIVSVKSNVNSPGKIIFDSILAGKDFILQNKMFFLLLWMSLIGGSLGKEGFKFKSLSEKVSNFLNDWPLRKKLEAETESINLDNEKKRILLNLFNNIKVEDINELTKASKILDIDTTSASNLINVDFKNKKNEDE